MYCNIMARVVHIVQYAIRDIMHNSIYGVYGLLVLHLVMTCLLMMQFLYMYNIVL